MSVEESKKNRKELINKIIVLFKTKKIVNHFNIFVETIQ